MLFLEIAVRSVGFGVRNFASGPSPPAAYAVARKTGHAVFVRTNGFFFRHDVACTKRQQGNEPDSA